MKYVLLDDKRVITNIIEIEPETAPAFNAHYLGDNALGIGDQYPEKDLKPLPEPTAEDDLAMMLVDHEYRLTLMELGVDINVTQNDQAAN